MHGVFRDTLGASPALVGGVTEDDPERVALIANYYENILSFLEAHHDGEEKIVFPLLRERCAGQDALVDHMDDQHHEALALLANARTSLAAWPGGGGAARQAARDDLAALHTHLLEHLGEEETKVLPLAAENLSVEEWGQLPAHGMANFRGDKIWLILGLIRERMTDEQRTAMLEHMPPPAVEMWTGFGEQAFADYSAEVAVPLENRAS